MPYFTQLLSELEDPIVPDADILTDDQVRRAILEAATEIGCTPLR